MDRIISGSNKERDFTKSTYANGNDKFYSNIDNNYFHSNIIILYRRKSSVKTNFREEYLKKWLEELDYVFDETSKEKTEYSKAVKASIMISRASALRKLNELNFNENYKIKAIDDLNNAIKHYISANNEHYKKYFITQYIAFKFQIATACFEMFKISNSEEYMKECKESIKGVKECCAKENNAYVIKKIDEISSELEK